MSDYSRLPGLEVLYLEEGWVLGVTARPGVLESVVDLLFRESHARYESPMASEQYCYHRGVLRCEGVSFAPGSTAGPRAVSRGRSASVQVVVVAANTEVVAADDPASQALTVDGTTTPCMGSRPICRW